MGRAVHLSDMGRLVCGEYNGVTTTCNVKNACASAPRLPACQRWLRPQPPAQRTHSIDRVSGRAAKHYGEQGKGRGREGFGSCCCCCFMPACGGHGAAAEARHMLAQRSGLRSQHAPHAQRRRWDQHLESTIVHPQRHACAQYLISGPCPEVGRTAASIRNDERTGL